MPNEALPRASPPRLSIGTDRHGGGCKDRLLPVLCHLHYHRNAPRGSIGVNFRTTPGAGTAEVVGWRTLAFDQLDDRALDDYPVGQWRSAVSPGPRRLQVMTPRCRQIRQDGGAKSTRVRTGGNGEGDAPNVRHRRASARGIAMTSWPGRSRCGLGRHAPSHSPTSNRRWGRGRRRGWRRG